LSNPSTDYAANAALNSGSATPNRARSMRQRAAAAARKRRVDVEDLLPAYVNADYAFWRNVWRSIRHAMIGEIEIKRHGAIYLPRMESMDDDQWYAYLERAVFYNMVYRTVTGLTGAIFRRDPRLLKVGPKLKKLTNRISKDGLSLALFTKVVCQEMLSVGRYGVLLDKAQDDLNPSVTPFFAGYTTENILDWTTAEIDGKTELDYVLLREFKVDRRLTIPSAAKVKGNVVFEPNSTYGQLFQRYRILRLSYNEESLKWEYTQELYERDHQDANLSEDPVITKPMRFGVPFQRIPFRFFNATTNLTDIEKPPILDILTLNLSHYRTYAQLEHGRFFTANPVYYVSGGNEDDDFYIGPSVVWQIEAGQTAGLIEFNGQGLKSLENALKTKEDQVASLGGRLLGESANAGQSDNQVKIKDRNEQSLLLNVTTVLNENFTYLLQEMAAWLNDKATSKDGELVIELGVDELVFRVNQDFLLDNAAAREFRAVTMMYQAGILPIEVIYEYFLKAEVIPEYMEMEQFIALLEDEKNFPNNPDIDAQKDGFANAADRDAFNLQEAELEHESEEGALQRKSQEKISKNQPKIPPVPGQAAHANAADPLPPGRTTPAPKPPKRPKPKAGATGGK
jgi:hypothetical protein